MRKPIMELYWGILYYGPRGACKSIQQARDCLWTLVWLDRYYLKHPSLQRSIVLTNQTLAEDLQKAYLGRSLYYWEKLSDLERCPRKNCWKGKEPHSLHNCYLFFDDVSTILPPDSWSTTPIWFRKMLAQARHTGVRTMANCQDPMALDINYRRYVDVAYKFRPIIKNRDPEETKAPVRLVFGIYQTRRIDAELLYKYGDLPEQQIRINMIAKEEQNDELEKVGKAYAIVYDDSWKGNLHYFTRRHTKIYDTTQNVKAKEIKGFVCKEIKCVDPAHVHPWDHPDKSIDELKKLPNFCKYVKKVYELV